MEKWLLLAGQSCFFFHTCFIFPPAESFSELNTNQIWLDWPIFTSSSVFLCISTHIGDVLMLRALFVCLLCGRVSWLNSCLCWLNVWSSQMGNTGVDGTDTLPPDELVVRSIAHKEAYIHARAIYTPSSVQTDGAEAQTVTSSKS